MKVDEQILTIQYCAKVMQTNFVEIPGFSGLFEEILLHAIFPHQIVIVRRIFTTPIACNGPIFRVIFRGTRWFAAIFRVTIRCPRKFVPTFPGKFELFRGKFAVMKR